MTTLLEPLTFRGGARSANRVAVAPMTNLQSHADGSLGEDELRWLERRAEGGFGIVSTCAAHVGRDGQGFRGQLGIFDDALLPGLTRLADALRRHGALGIAQLYHGGERSDRALTGERPWAPSEHIGAAPDEGPRAATDEDIARVIRQFGEATARAARAGFDGVELHGAHGYLLTQFLNAGTNRRSDGYGGSLEGRARLLREVVRAARAAAPAPFVVGIRLSPEDFGHVKGLDLDDSLQTARWLVEDGVDFVHLSLWKSRRNSAKYPEQHAVSLFRAALPPAVRLLAAGDLWTRDDAAWLLDQGADAVALGRAAIANPDWPQRVARHTAAAGAAEAAEIRRPPLTRAELGERSLSATFIDYLQGWKGFVAS